MKLLLDECIPRKFKDHLQGHDCVTVPEAGLAGKKNGELLLFAQKTGFDAFLTLDRGIEYEQNLTQLRVAVVLILSRASRLAEFQPHAREILKVMGSIQ